MIATRALSTRATTVAVLLCSAFIGTLLLIAGLWLNEARLNPPMVLTGSALHFSQGAGETTSQGVEIRNVGLEDTAILVGTFAGVPADRYRTVTWSLAGLGETRDLRILWQTHHDRQTAHSRKLSQREIAAGRIEIGAEPDWKGQIVGLGIGFVLQMPLTEPVLLSELSLLAEPPSLAQTLATLMRGWTRFDSWSDSSINRYTARPEGARPPPVVTVALWIALSTLVYLMLQRPTSIRTLMNTLAILILIGWLALDMRWQADLRERLAKTQRQYAGLASTEVRTSSRADAALLRAARELREHLPEQPARIFILSDDPGSFMPARMRYHLVPHRAFNGLSHLPPATQVRSGDFILILGAPKWVRYEWARRALVEQGTLVPAEPLHRILGIGSLYRVGGGT